MYKRQSQYTPLDSLDKKAFPELAVKVRHKNYERLVDYTIDLGVEQAFIQEGETAKESFIPPFTLEEMCIRDSTYVM